MYRQLLRDHQRARAQSRCGNRYSNAQAENRLKVFVPLVPLPNEVLKVRKRPIFVDLAEMQASVADYFDYYNRGLRFNSRTSTL